MVIYEKEMKKAISIILITAFLLNQCAADSSALRPVATRKAGRGVLTRRGMVKASAVVAGAAALSYFLNYNPMSLGFYIRNENIALIKSHIDHPKWSDAERVKIIWRLSLYRPDVAEAYIAFLKSIAENASRDNEIRGDAIVSLDHLVFRGNAEAQQILINLEKTRSAEEVLPDKRIRKKVLLTILDRTFDGREYIFKPRHGQEVEATMRHALGDDADSAYINPMYMQAQLLELQKENDDSIIIVCRSACFDFNPFEVNGLFNPEFVKSLGKMEVVFVVSAGDTSTFRIFMTPLFDNVIVVGAAKRTASGLIRGDYSARGIDIDFYTNGRFQNRSGTSFASPRITALLYLYLTHHPEASVPEAIQFFRDIAEPMPPDELFRYGVRKPGYIGVEEVRSKIRNSSPGKAEITVPVEKQDSIVPSFLALPFAQAA